MCWHVNTEKLLSHVVLNDLYATTLSSNAGPAFFRAFIVEERATGRIKMKYRFKYKDGNRNWFALTHQKIGEDAIKDFEAGLKEMLIQACATLLGVPLPESAVKFFRPPDDEGDGQRTIVWLIEQDLIEPPEILTEEEAKERGLT